MENSINISFDFIDKYVRFTKPEYIQVYLYVKYILKKQGEIPSAEMIAKALDISQGKAEFILEYWSSRGEFFEDSDEESYSKPSDAQKIKRLKSTKPSYSQAEVNAVATANKQISGLFYQAETILNKVLTASDMEMLFSFHDWLGLPPEVIMMLLSYAAKRGKTTKRYLETVAIDWADKGIDTFDAAEEYVSELEAADSAEREICGILGIYNRALTVTEKKYIKLWTRDMQVKPELISLAYDRTVGATGKLSYGYMNKILENWQQKGCQTAKDVEAADEEFYKSSEKTVPQKRTKKSGFNNYEDDNKNDYAELEEQILDMMLDEG